MDFSRDIDFQRPLYIYIYIYNYLYLYIEKRTEHSHVLLQKNEMFLSSFPFFGKLTLPLTLGSVPDMVFCGKRNPT